MMHRETVEWLMNERATDAVLTLRQSFRLLVKCWNIFFYSHLLSSCLNGAHFYEIGKRKRERNCCWLGVCLNGIIWQHNICCLARHRQSPGALLTISISFVLCWNRFAAVRMHNRITIETAVYIRSKMNYDHRLRSPLIHFSTRVLSCICKPVPVLCTVDRTWEHTQNKTKWYINV